jgi:hypothetical protein
MVTLEERIREIWFKSDMKGLDEDKQLIKIAISETRKDDRKGFKKMIKDIDGYLTQYQKDMIISRIREKKLVVRRRNHQNKSIRRTKDSHPTRDI